MKNSKKTLRFEEDWLGCIAGLFLVALIIIFYEFIH